MKTKVLIAALFISTQAAILYYMPVAIVFEIMIAFGLFFSKLSKSETVESEWRCGCPRDDHFDTSINPSYVKYCAKCCQQRPTQE